MAHQHRTLSLLVTIIAVCHYAAAAAGVEISLYKMNPDQLNSLLETPDFGNIISDEAAIYCESACDAVFHGNLTTWFSNVKDSSTNANVTVNITASTGTQLSKSKTTAMFKDRVESINARSNQLITSADEEFFGIPADNPTNWIIIAVFVVFTLALLLVVLYLSKHKVNHEEEHYEGLKERDTSADGEIAS